MKVLEFICISLIFQTISTPEHLENPIQIGLCDFHILCSEQILFTTTNIYY